MIQVHLTHFSAPQVRFYGVPHRGSPQADNTHQQACENRGCIGVCLPNRDLLGEVLLAPSAHVAHFALVDMEHISRVEPEAQIRQPHTNVDKHIDDVSADELGSLCF